MFDAFQNFWCKIEFCIKNIVILFDFNALLRFSKIYYFDVALFVKKNIFWFQTSASNAIRMEKV